MRYFLVILRGLFFEGMSADLVAQQLWPLALIAIATLASASSLFRHRMS